MAIIQRRTLSEEVALLIAEEIRQNQYMDNHRLPIETELMKQFGVGRSTIREAVKLLSNNGLLSVKQGIGTFIKKNGGVPENLDLRILDTGYRDVHEIRDTLEVRMIQKSALRRSRYDLEIMKLNLRERERAILNDDLRHCISADLKLHNTIAEGCKNPALIILYKSLTSYLEPFYLNLKNSQRIFKESHEYHMQLVEGIEKKNIEQAKHSAERILAFFN